MKYKKLLVNTWFKKYSIMTVSKECFNNSLSIESIGSMTGFKIKDKGDLDFRIAELQRLGFTCEVL